VIELSMCPHCDASLLCESCGAGAPEAAAREARRRGGVFEVDPASHGGFPRCAACRSALFCRSCGAGVLEARRESAALTGSSSGPYRGAPALAPSPPDRTWVIYAVFAALGAIVALPLLGMLWGLLRSLLTGR
jgi:hypothetical protein